MIIIFFSNSLAIFGISNPDGLSVRLIHPLSEMGMPSFIAKKGVSKRKTTRPEGVWSLSSNLVVPLYYEKTFKVILKATLPRLTRPHLNLTRQRTRIHFQQIHHHFTNVFRLNFPVVGGVGFVVIEMRCHGAGHDG